MRMATLTALWMVVSGAIATGEDYETLKQFYRYRAGTFEFEVGTDGQGTLKMQGPVFTWTGLDYQEFRDTAAPNSGDVFVWTLNGRAVVVGGVLSQPIGAGREVYHEFQALIDTPPMPIRSPTKWGELWSPVGVKLRPIPQAPAPSKGSDRVARRQRDVQMRGLARQFTAETRSATTGKIQSLKLQPNAVFRLDASALRNANSSVLDGCLFIFTNQLGTDPELTLLIECHKTDNGLIWKYAPGSLAFQELWLKHKGKSVWHLPNYLEHPGEGNFVSSLSHANVSMREIKQEMQP
ncbi:hypothetical protein Enr13x_57360 [Stieleria neptunia]|uniref:Uncharacterized protein n=1 Tax=Stieleria neptunia TaxID=2527979 RepID=A0A518HY94_9BACT|nr:hypothetical protein [Stieleria neptunia]QDV45833.1 hypothetical protein Enr13x_57360 [Stieleria neptunia]